MIIGVSGKIGSGKDTFAAALMELQPEKNWQVKKFAGKLKLIASILAGVPVEKFEDQEFKKQDMSADWNKQGFPGKRAIFASMTYRSFLQKLGTDAMRDGLHTNVWVNALFADYKPTYKIIDFMKETYPDTYAVVPDGFPNWIITDVRFPNEAEAVRQRGGKLIRINRFENTGDHPSETALDNWQDWDWTINNIGSIDAFRQNVKTISGLFN